MGNISKFQKHLELGFCVSAAWKAWHCLLKYHVQVLRCCPELSGVVPVLVKFGHEEAKTLVGLINKDALMNLHELLHKKGTVIFQSGIWQHVQCSLMQL